MSAPLALLASYPARDRVRPRLLAVTGSARSKFALDAPTYADQGFAELVMRAVLVQEDVIDFAVLWKMLRLALGHR